MTKTIKEHVKFNEMDHTFTISNGSVGTYSCDDVLNCQILYEDHRYKGSTPMFSHLLWIEGMQPFWSSPNLWTGVCFSMQDGKKLYAYISDEPVQLNSLQFHKATKEAEEICKKLFRNRLENDR